MKNATATDPLLLAALGLLGDIGELGFCCSVGGGLVRLVVVFLGRCRATSDGHRLHDALAGRFTLGRAGRASRRGLTEGIAIAATLMETGKALVESDPDRAAVYAREAERIVRQTPEDTRHRD
ncbi:hypothetical protein [Streptomyces sp. NPDC058335]|uniref:hypothetical protein n=1 Tax=Streptomyces sp. NPDC058335 TaxID=3346451 RepID=UPI003654707C